MASGTLARPQLPQALSTTLATRLTKNSNSLFSNVSTTRAAKRNASRINYAEDYPELEFADEDAQDEDGDANYEDTNAGFDIYRGLSNFGQSSYMSSGAKPAPTELNENIVFSEAETLQNCQLPDTVVPIKINVSYNGIIIKDSILWNMNDELVTPETVAYLMCEDLDLGKTVESTIVNQIRDQIQSYDELLANPNNQIIDQFLVNEKEFHVVLELSVYIGEDFFTDRVEWNFLDHTYTPEMFAKQVVEDMALRKEFETAIACAIYDEIYKVKRELVENPQQVTQYIDTLPFFNLVHQTGDIEDASMLTVQGVRYDKKKLGEEFSPALERLSEWEIEKRETEKERNLRRRKRETMRVR